MVKRKGNAGKARDVLMTSTWWV